MISHLARSVKQSEAFLVARCLCVVLPATLQNEEVQRVALARPGGGARAHALHAWLVVGAPSRSRSP
eukprot:6341432-Lingulodinium_polyedra.AAC.1